MPNRARAGGDGVAARSDLRLVSRQSKLAQPLQAANGIVGSLGLPRQGGALLEPGQALLIPDPAVEGHRCLQALLGPVDLSLCRRQDADGEESAGADGEWADVARRHASTRRAGRLASNSAP